MEETDWDRYGTGNYEKCADCMVHCGYEATAVSDTLNHPLKALRVALLGPRTKGEMAPEIRVSKFTRSARYSTRSRTRAMSWNSRPTKDNDGKRDREDGVSAVDAEPARAAE